MLKGRKQRPVRADKKGRWKDTRHGTSHFTTWRPTEPEAVSEAALAGRSRRRRPL